MELQLGQLWLSTDLLQEGNGHTPHDTTLPRRILLLDRVFIFGSSYKMAS